MADKILFWLDGDIIHFGIAKYLQKNYDCKLYAIIDITNEPKPFFKNQNIVNFQKQWFYHDYLQNLKDPDISYLSNFEKKYDLNFSELMINDRLFFQYNDYYKFSDNEIFSILENECKLFEKILDEIEPNFLVIHETTLRQHHLLHKICIKRGIKILMLNFSNFGQRSYISEIYHKLDFLPNLENLQHSNRNFSDLQDLLKSDKTSTRIMNFYKKYQNSKIDIIKAALHFLFVANNSNIKTHYSYRGRTKIRVLFKEIIFNIKKKHRESFVNKNLSYTIDENESFIFFPMHQEPERSLLISSPFHNNQIEIIKQIAKSLPVGYKLYVKEHPTQGKGRGWRSTSVYKQIMDIPNVKLIHPSIHSYKILPHCSLVVSISGTTCFESAFYEKPSITFADDGYNILPSIYRMKSIEELPKLIHSALKTNVKVTDIDKYVTFLEENSFDFDYPSLVAAYHNRFYFGGNLIDVNISIPDMEAFLLEQELIFEKLALEHIKKIKQHNLKIKEK